MSQSARKPPAFATSFSLDDLDAIVGGVGLQAPAGGSIRETTSDYRWWGMNYQQTTREAVDANGNVVGSEVYRPGSVYSDRTTTTSEGTSTEYSTGGHVGDDQAGAGFNASFTTNHDASGNFTGAQAHADGEAHANTAYGNYSANGNADGNLTVGPNGALSADGHAQGEVAAVDPNTGYGVALRGEANGSGSINDNGVSWNADAHASGYVTQNGEDVAGLRLGEAGTSGHYGYDENGNLHGSADFHGGALGERVGVHAEGTYNADGTLEGSATANYHAGTENGRYSASFDANAGINGTYHPDGSVDAGVTGGASGNVHAGQFNASAEVNGGGTAHFDENGNYAGTDVQGSGQAEVNGPGGFNASVNGQGEAHFDENNNVTGASGEANEHVGLAGESLDAHQSGTYDPNQGQDQNYDHNNEYSGANNDSGNNEYSGANNEYSGGSNEYSGGSNEYSGGSNEYSGGSNETTDYASNDSGSSYDSGSSGGDAAYA